jgi:hypothetical protein
MTQINHTCLRLIARGFGRRRPAGRDDTDKITDGTDKFTPVCSSPPKAARRQTGLWSDNFLSLRSFHFSLFSTHYTCLWQAGIISKRILDSMDKDKFTG